MDWTGLDWTGLVHWSLVSQSNRAPSAPSDNSQQPTTSSRNPNNQQPGPSQTAKGPRAQELKSQEGNLGGGSRYGTPGCRCGRRGGCCSGKPSGRGGVRGTRSRRAATSRPSERCPGPPGKDPPLLRVSQDSNFASGLLQPVDDLPVLFHIYHCPTFRPCLGEALVQAADAGLSIVSPFALSIRVMDE